MQTQQVKMIVKAIVVVLVLILVLANLGVLSTKISLTFFGIGGTMEIANFWALLAAFVLGAIVWPMVWRGLFRRKPKAGQ